MSQIKNPSVLAFERKIDPSDAVFYAVNWSGPDNGDAVPVALREKSVRGTISNRMKGGEADPAKLDAAIENPNLQTVDVAALPMDKDTLKVQFTVRILGGVGCPSACNESAYQKKLAELVEQFKKEVGFDELARRYAWNLASGRFLWRNRLAAEEVRVTVRQMKEGKPVAEWAFNAGDYSLRDFPEKPDLLPLADVICQALNTKDGCALLEVTALARMGRGQEVFPSQELVMKSSSGKKSKTLYAVQETAAMHSQKIGNAIRTVDTWYPECDNMPIALEPYGSVTSQGKAYRQPRQKQDFYSLLDAWMLKDKKPDAEQQNYVMGILIRGGVFGEAEKEK